MPEHSLESIYQRLEEKVKLLREKGIDLELVPQREIWTEPTLAPEDSPVLQSLLQASYRIRGKSLPVVGVPIQSDARHFLAKGISTVNFGPGRPENGVHGTNEHLEISDLMESIKILVLAAGDLLGPGVIWMLSADLVKKAAFNIGFDLVGITQARPLTSLEELFRKGERITFESPFIKATPEERWILGLPRARSIIMVGLSYYAGIPKRRSPTGFFSRSAWEETITRSWERGYPGWGSYFQFDPALVTVLLWIQGPLPERNWPVVPAWGGWVRIPP